MHHHGLSSYAPMKCPSIHSRNLSVAAAEKKHEFIDEGNVSCSTDDDSFRMHFGSFTHANYIASHNF